MPDAVAIWVWFCAFLNAAGWALSAVHQLNAGGYAVVLLVWLAALLAWRKRTSARFLPDIRWQKILRRFRRPLPLAFLILAALALLGGSLYPPTNYDALAYRIPRILHWLAADRWHWIHTIFPRVNDRSCGIEWVSAPFIVLLRTDRLLFLINIVSFLLLPGLIFSVFTRLGVRRRVAWHWMWLVPTGYCFLLQAGSIGNDLFGAPFALAAVDFALRARTSGRQRDFFASFLAAAMLASAKTSSLPLGLPWAIAILPAFRLALRWPVKTLAVCLLAVFASVLPTLVLNQKFSADWSGANLGRADTISDAAWRTGANAFIIPLQNLVPPIFPAADAWNRDVKRLMPPALSTRLHRVMLEPEAAELTLPQMQIEENAGLGFGVSLLVLGSFLGVKLRRHQQLPAPANREAAGLTLLRWSPAVSLLAVMTQCGLSVFCRLLTPYYALLLPIFLAGPAQEALVRKKGWRAAAFAVVIIAAGPLVLSPARPLFPIQTLLSQLRHPPARVQAVYAVYRGRNDAFAPARAALPPGLKILGMVTADDPETSLWRPFGSRRIFHVCPLDTPAQLKQRGIEYVLVNPAALQGQFGCPLEDWLKRMRARVVRVIPLDLRASTGTLDWSLVQLQ